VTHSIAGLVLAFTKDEAERESDAARRPPMTTTATRTAPSRTPNTECDKRNELITEHLHLVTAIATHMQRSIPVHIELDDLIHAGMNGLFDAATKYCEDKGVVFPTYAKHRIRGAILDSLRQSDWASRDLRKRYRQMESTTNDLTTKLGRTPTEAEVAKEMGLNSRRWQSLMVDFRSLNAAATQTHPQPGDDQMAPEIPASPVDAPDRLCARAELCYELGTAIRTLPARYQQIVKMYYEHDMTMKEIGTQLGVNESRVSQIHKAALERMQAALANNGIHTTAAFHS
jgi:RNA polymerase sigma factor for flagellar operon FliA